MSDQLQDDPRVYFAAERILSGVDSHRFGADGRWLRSGTLRPVLRQLRATEKGTLAHSMGGSVPSGHRGGVGCAGTSRCGVTAHGTVRELRSGTWQPGRISTLAVALALVLTSMGVAIAVYLLLFR